MQPMKLGTQALPPTEVELVRMLLRLYGQDGEFNWIYADAPPYDALLVDASTLDTEHAYQESSKFPHVRRLARGLDDPDALHRPLNADTLRNWLKEVKKEVEKTTPAATSTAARSLSSLVVNSTLPEPSEVSSLPPDGGPRFRLERWPHQIILRKDPARIRMATLLSRRALSTRDLVALTGFDTQRCQVFMQVLQAASLLTPVPQDTANQTSGVAISGARLSGPGKNRGPYRGASSAKSRPTSNFIAGMRELLGLS